MNTELIKEAAEPSKKPEPGKKRPAKRKPVANRESRPSVTYSDEELVAVEGQPFWNFVHDATVKSVSEDGLCVAVAKDGKEIDVHVASTEIAPGPAKKPGDSLRVYVEDVFRPEGSNEHPFIGSEVKAIELDLLARAVLAQAKHEAIDAFIIGPVKGGYSLALFASSQEQADAGFGIRAFLPLGRAGLRRTEGIDDKNDGLIKVTIAALDAARGNIVVSRREILAAERKKDEEAFFAGIHVGDEVVGKVSALMPYGAFVNLGAVDGFLHISDISWDKKPRLRDIVPEGKEIHAKVIGIDHENKRVKLSLKDLNPDPWSSIDKKYKPGTEVDGTIVAFADFGAFVKLQDGVEGLIHVGEITWNRIKHPSQHFKIGDQVRAAVLRVDKESRRISLSTKAIEQSPVERLSAQFPIGTVIKTKIASIHDFGLFVELDEESNGLVPRSEISWVRSDEPIDQKFKVGQEIEAAVLGFDPQRQRVSCSIKRLTKDPWPGWMQKYKKGSIHKVKILSLDRAGAECLLEGELHGFCPRGQLAQDDVGEHSKVAVKVGSEVEMFISNCDYVRQRISLSQRQASESKTKEAYATYLNQQNRGNSARATLGDAFKNIDLNKGKK